MTDTKNTEEFSEDNIPVSNWMKFPKIGDWIVGTFNSKSVKEGDDKFKSQMIYVLTNVKGVMDGKALPVEDASDEWNLGITIKEGSKNFLNNKFKKLVPGLRMGLKFEKEVDGAFPGKPAKSYMPNVFKMDPTFEEFTEEATEKTPVDVYDIV